MATDPWTNLVNLNVTLRIDPPSSSSSAYCNRLLDVGLPQGPQQDPISRFKHPITASYPLQVIGPSGWASDTTFAKPRPPFENLFTPPSDCHCHFSLLHFRTMSVTTSLSLFWLFLLRVDRYETPTPSRFYKKWLSASHTRARRVPNLFLVFVVIAATIIHHP